MLFRPMFFVMVVTLLISWSTIFESISDLSIWHFRVFLLGWIAMFAVTVLFFTCYGPAIFAKLRGPSQKEEDPES